MIENELHYIPDPDTFNNLFKDWDNEELADLSEFTMSDPLSVGSKLIREENQ